MSLRALRRWGPILGIVVVVVVLSAPSGILGASAASAGLPVSPSAVTSAASRAASHPAVFMCPRPPFAYGALGGPGAFFPPSPSLTYQYCPGPLAQDMVHGTFSSNAPGSGERFTERVYLPTNGSPGQDFAYNDFLLGMVVGGDPGSAFGQSYAQLSFTPIDPVANTTVGWTLQVSVWSLLNSTAGANCLGQSMAVAWNNSQWCETDEVGDGGGFTGPTGIAGATWYNVTFDGVKGNSSGLWIWANDSTNRSAANNVSFQLNLTNTGTHVFEPKFNSSCPDACFLNWSYPFGLGIGWDLCPIASEPFASCDSYNQTNWDGAPSAEFGIPEFYVNSTLGYAGDYALFAPMSASAECSSSAVVPIANCPNYSGMGGSGWYPFFSWNGTALNFGDDQPYTLDDFGGESQEYIQSGPFAKDYVPMFLNYVTNDSRSGYIRPSLALNVSAEVSDLGTIKNATLVYTVNSGAPTSLVMTRLSGTAQRGVYNGTIPSGANGWINYTITAYNHAGQNISSKTYVVFRGPLPVFAVTLGTFPPFCTNLTLNGTVYANGSVVHVNPGSYPVTSSSCYPFQFNDWQATPGIHVTVSNDTSGPFGNVSVSTSGNLTAVWRYVRPLIVVQYLTNPATCTATADFDGVTYSPGENVSLRFGDLGNVTNLGSCGGLSFAGWNLTGNLTLEGYNFTAGGNGSLTANFVTTSSASALTFGTTPPGCGGVLYRGVGYTNRESLYVNSTPYPVAPDPCSHFGFTQFVTTGGASLVSGNLTVTSSGSISEKNYILTEVLILTTPYYCTVQFDGVTEKNGTVLVVQNNSTHIVTQNPCTGHYPFSLTASATGMSFFGSELTVNGSGTVYANWLTGSPSSFLEFQTDPGTCGSILFGAVRYFDTNYTEVAPNTSAALTATPCSAYGFVRWQTTGGVVVHDGIAYVNSSGSLEAVFRPIAIVNVQTEPTGCGSVMLAGSDYATNDSATLTEDVPYPIVAVPCAHFQFQSWANTVGAIITGGDIYLSGQAIVTATFTPSAYNVTVLINPAGCGSLYVNGESDTNGTSLNLTYGVYPTHAAPCLGNVLVTLNSTGGVTVAGGNVTVGGNGTLTAIYAPIFPIVTLQVPSGSLAGQSVVLAAAVGVPVPPYTYNYTWTFGDGGTVTTPANFTQHTYAAPGSYVVSVTVHDPYNRTAEANQTIVVVSSSGSSTSAIPTSTLIVLGLAGLAVVAIAVLALWTRRPAPPATSEESASTAEPTLEAEDDEYTMPPPPSNDQA
ncbi:MAG: PKD domain-containing protein [Thermoplasmata archaeon]|nr:PKD domain-containing protein [Thermoplasmata archaeon]